MESIDMILMGAKNGGNLYRLAGNASRKTTSKTATVEINSQGLRDINRNQ